MFSELMRSREFAGGEIKGGVSFVLVANFCFSCFFKGL